MNLIEFLLWSVTITIFGLCILVSANFLKDLYCVQTFEGVWSSIVIGDCSGSFWSPTNSRSGVDGGLHEALTGDHQIVFSE